MRFDDAMPDLISVRVAREEKQKLAALARRRGVTISDFVRELTTKATKRVAA